MNSPKQKRLSITSWPGRKAASSPATALLPTKRIPPVPPCCYPEKPALRAPVFRLKIHHLRPCSGKIIPNLKPVATLRFTPMPPSVWAFTPSTALRNHPAKQKICFTNHLNQKPPPRRLQVPAIRFLIFCWPVFTPVLSLPAEIFFMQHTNCLNFMPEFLRTQQVFCFFREAIRQTLPAHSKPLTLPVPKTFPLTPTSIPVRATSQETSTRSSMKTRWCASPGK